MRGLATALVVAAVAASGDHAAAQLLNRTSQPPAVALQTGWTDHPIRPGVTPIKSVHIDELRARVAALRAQEGLAPAGWTDPVLTPGATTVTRTHLAELRASLGGVYDAREQLQPAYADRTLTAGRTPVRPFGDLNGDGRPDMFIAGHGWDAEPFPGEQNRLYLSRPGGGWRDATGELPRLSDFSHPAAISDRTSRSSG